MARNLPSARNASMKCWKQLDSPTAPITALINSPVDNSSVSRSPGRLPPNLDTENGKQVMDIMQRLNKETGVTFVFATHDPRVIGYADRVVTLQDGLITKDSKTNGKP